MKNIDSEIWQKVWVLLSEPGRFEAALEERISQLQSEEIDAEVECESLQKMLDDLVMERQRIVTAYRKGIITEEDLEMQLIALTLQENDIHRDLVDKRLLVGSQAERLMELSQVYRERVQSGLEEINSEPESKEQEKRIIKFQRKIIEAIVTRVDVWKGGRIKVHTEIDLSINDMSSR